MRTLIVEDEMPAIRILRKFCGALDFIDLVGICRSAEEAIHRLDEQKADLLLVDVRLPGLSGVDLARQLSDASMQIVFTTAFPDYALQGFEVEAADYLLKPFSFDRFEEACKRAQQRWLAHQRRLPPIYLREGRTEYKLWPRDIRFAEACGDYLKVYTVEGMLMCKMKMYELADMLPSPPFERVHRSWLVNMDEVQHSKGNKIRIGNTEIPLSRSYRKSRDQQQKNDDRAAPDRHSW